MNRDKVDEEAKRLAEMANAQVKEERLIGMSLGTIARCRTIAENVFGKDWSIDVMRTMDEAPRIVALEYRGAVEP